MKGFEKPSYGSVDGANTYANTNVSKAELVKSEEEEAMEAKEATQ